MRFSCYLLIMVCSSVPLYAADTEDLQKEIDRLKYQTQSLQNQLDSLNQKEANTSVKEKVTKEKNLTKKTNRTGRKKIVKPYHSSAIEIHALDVHPESLHFYPTALIAEGEVLTYIAGTPVVSSPYLGERPAFDGSDYIVNISSINRDIRLMQQRRSLYRTYESLGYPIPDMPIIFLSGAAEPVMTFNHNSQSRQIDFTLGRSELDVASALNANVEAFMSIAYDDSPPPVGGPRVNNSAFNLNLGFINIGNLDKTPLYFTAGQLYVPFGRYASAMASAPLTLLLARTKSRPFIAGYKSQAPTGPFVALYGFRGETTLNGSGNGSGVGGGNFGYIFGDKNISGEVGAGYISSINDSAGMQNTGVTPFTVFGGFGSVTNGNEAVKKIPGANVYGQVRFDRYNLLAEWVGATKSFRPQDLSYNGRAAKPQAGQLEAGMTFIAFDKPASIGLGYQYTRQALALSVPKQRISGVFNISIWKDTVETIEYRHDINYSRADFANGIAPAGVVNAPVRGLGGSSDAVVVQIGVYF